MGGIGSGPRPGFGTGTCEERGAIDLAWVRRQGWLSPGGGGTLGWTRHGRPLGSVRLSIGEHGVQITRPDGRSEFAFFTHTRAAFGGWRVWFACPACERPCRVLYDGARFRCRRCHGLRYTTQRQRSFDRVITRAQVVRMRLGGSPSLVEPFPPKPKGMHWRTYRCLEQCDRRLLGGITAAAGRPLGFRTAYKTC
jgi:hypothetical protein